MIQVLLGYRPYDFTNREGEQVKGVSLYTTYEPDDEYLVGFMTDKLNVARVPKHIDSCINKEINVEFNNRGKVAQIIYPEPAVSKPA